jgi:hypothetical protein
MFSYIFEPFIGFFFNCRFDGFQHEISPMTLIFKIFYAYNQLISATVLVLNMIKMKIPE